MKIRTTYRVYKFEIKNLRKINHWFWRKEEVKNPNLDILLSNNCCRTCLCACLLDCRSLSQATTFTLLLAPALCLSAFYLSRSLSSACLLISSCLARSCSLSSLTHALYKAEPIINYFSWTNASWFILFYFWSLWIFLYWNKFFGCELVFKNLNCKLSQFRIMVKLTQARWSAWKPIYFLVSPRSGKVIPVGIRYPVVYFLPILTWFTLKTSWTYLSELLRTSFYCKLLNYLLKSNHITSPK